MKSFLSAFNILCGLGMYGVWIRYLSLGNIKGTFFKWRGERNIMWPHVLIELLTAGALILSGVGMLYDLTWAKILAIFALGSLFYASFNSLSWIFAQEKRWPYTPAVLVGLIGSFVLILFILIELKH